jgi:hypothetical protein
MERLKVKRLIERSTQHHAIMDFRGKKSAQNASRKVLYDAFSFEEFFSLPSGF